MLQIGSRREEVKIIQRQLNALGFNCGIVDGDFGPITKMAVVAFQRTKGLTDDGVIGTITATALDKAIASKQAVMYLKRGAESTNVKVAQAKLKALGFSPGPIDGIFGGRTESAVIAFQQSKQILDDGIAGPQTLGLLESSYDKITTKSTPVQTLPVNKLIIRQFPNHFNQVPKRTQTKFGTLHHQAGMFPDTVEGINKLHMEVNGWSGGGYSVWVNTAGEAFLLRPLDLVGAHTYGLNDIAIGVCLQGNLSETEPTQAQLDCLAWLIPYMESLCPGIKWIGHKEAVQYSEYARPTACPGEKFPLAEIEAKYN